MPAKVFLPIVTCLIATSAFGQSVYRCVDPITDSVTFTDRLCAHSKPVTVEIRSSNSALGLSEKQKHLTQQLNQKLKHHDVANNRSEYGSSKKAQQKRCQKNNVRIRQLHSRLRQGYKANKYDHYHNKLRILKDYRNRYCT